MAKPQSTRAGASHCDAKKIWFLKNWRPNSVSLFLNHQKIEYRFLVPPMQPIHAPPLPPVLEAFLSLPTPDDAPRRLAALQNLCLCLEEAHNPPGPKGFRPRGPRNTLLNI